MSTRKTIGEGAIFAVGSALPLILGKVIPDAFLLLSTIGIFSDIIDPYDYNHTLTRESLDDAAQQGHDFINGIINNKDVNDAVRLSIKQTAPTLTESEITILISQLLSHYKMYTVIPDNYTSCFSDMATGDINGDISMSGNPTERCPPEYKAAYNIYYQSNEEFYRENNIITNEKVIEITNKLSDLFAQRYVTKQRNEYVSQLIVFSVLVILSMLIILIAYGIILRKEKRNKV